jgi:hypothetical protein
MAAPLEGRGKKDAGSIGAIDRRFEGKIGPFLVNISRLRENLPSGRAPEGRSTSRP